MNVHITIRGRQFNVRTNDDVATIQNMAAALDRRLNEQAERARSFDEHSVAVITALNLMSELFLVREKLSEQIEDLERDLESVMAMLESLLPEQKAP